MKPSRYNFVWPADNGRLMLFNSLSTALAEAPSKVRGLLEAPRFDAEDLPQSLKGTVDQLKTGGFFVDDEHDEIETLKTAVARLTGNGTTIDLTIAPTLRCNFACAYCYEQTGEGEASRQGRNAVMPAEVQAGLLQRLEREFESVKKVNILWFGGEPLMGRAVIFNLSRKMIRLAEDKGVAYRAGMISNGYHVDAETVRKLVESRLAFAQITLDGPPLVHDARRMLKRSGGPTFDRVLDGIKRLSEAGISVTVRINADRTNKEAALELPSILLRNGVGNVSITLGRVAAYTSGCQSVAGDCLSYPEFAELDRRLQDAAAAAGFKVAPFLSYPTSVNVVCIARRSKPIVVDPDGEVYKCWNEIGKAEYRIGNITNFDDRTSAEAARETKWVAWDVFSEPRCRACKLLPTCLGGCAYGPMVKGEQAECTLWAYHLESYVRARYQKEKALRRKPALAEA